MRERGGSEQQHGSNTAPLHCCEVNRCELALSSELLGLHELQAASGESGERGERGPRHWESALLIMHGIPLPLLCCVCDQPTQPRDGHSLQPDSTTQLQPEEQPGRLRSTTADAETGGERRRRVSEFGDMSTLLRRARPLSWAKSAQRRATFLPTAVVTEGRRQFGWVSLSVQQLKHADL